MTEQKVSEEVFEYSCTQCKTKIKEEDEICPKCGADLTIDDEREKINESYKTKTFLSYGKFVYVFGIIVIIIGVFVIFGALVDNKILYAIGGFTSILFGIGFLIYSHFIYCLSAIEKNTRELLQVFKTRNKA